MGYLGLARSLAVEFDTWDNGPDGGDPDGNHVAVHSAGTDVNDPGPETRLGVTSLGEQRLADGAVHQARVTYDPVGTLSVFVDDMTVPQLSVPVDLETLLDLEGGNAWVGFTAATGAGFENHDLLTWQMCPAAADRDLRVTTSAQPDTVDVGEPVTLTATVTNEGNAVAADVVLTDVLPAGVVFQSASPGCGHLAGVVTCQLGSIAPGGELTRQFVVIADRAGTALVNTVAVPAASDPTPANNTATATFTVELARGSITVEVGTQPLARQDFAFSVTGSGLSPFSLDNDTDAALPNSITFDNLEFGQYSVTQDLVTGWSLDAARCDTGSETTGSTVSIALSSTSPDVTCHFGNAHADAVIPSIGPLTNIFLSTQLNCQVDHIGDTAHEFFGEVPGACATEIATGDQLYGPNTIPAGNSPGGYVFVSQSSVTGDGTVGDPFTVVTVVDAGESGLRLTQTDTYVVGSESYRSDVVVSNRGASAADFVLYRGGDCYLQGSDQGFGELDMETGAVYCRASDDGGSTPGARIQGWIPLTAGSSAIEAAYFTVWGEMGRQTAFPNTCLCDTYTDNGAGLSWTGTLVPGESGTYSHLTVFSPTGVASAFLDKTAAQPSTVAGGINSYTITIENPTGTPMTATSLVDHLPDGFQYVAGSTSGVTTADPVITGQDLTWNGSFDVPALSSATLSFSVVVAATPGTYTNSVDASGSLPIAGATAVAPITVTTQPTGQHWRIGGFSPARAGSSWTLYGERLTTTRGYITDPTNFGPDGIVPESYTIGPELDTVTLASLQNYDVFFTGWISTDSYSPAEKQALIDYVEGGGVLIATTDDSGHTMVDAFGLTQADGSGNPTANSITKPGHPIAAGPFGAVTEYNQYLATGHYPSIPANAVEIGRNANGTTIAVIEPGELGAGSGAAIFVSDVDVFSEDGAVFNATLIKNIFAYATTIAAGLPINEAPVANEQTVSTSEDTPVGVTLDGSDPDGDTLTFTVVDTPAHGALTGTGANRTYVPDANFNGLDSFTYKVNDGRVDSPLAVVTINVAAVNDPPTADAQSVSAAEDTPLGITLAGADVDGDDLAFTVVTQPAHGSLSGVGADRTYVPDANYFGPDSFTYKVNDGLVDSAAATVTIDVTSVNDAPTADPKSVSTVEDTAVDITLSGNDLEGSTLSFAITGSPAHGIVAGTGANRTYTPDPNYFGPDSFTYTVIDGLAHSASATVTIDVRPANDPPTATITVGTPRTEGASIPLSVTVADVDGDDIGIIWTNQTGLLDLGGACTLSSATGATTALLCTDDGVVTVTATAADGITTTTAQATVVVTNAAPNVAIRPIVAPGIAPAPVTIVADVADAGSNDTQTCTIAFGDGTSQTVPVVGGVCTATATATAGGTFTATVTATDDDNGQGSATAGYAVTAPTDPAPAVDAGARSMGPRARRSRSTGRRPTTGRSRHSGATSRERASTPGRRVRSLRSERSTRRSPAPMTARTRRRSPRQTGSTSRWRTRRR